MEQQDFDKFKELLVEYVETVELGCDTFVEKIKLCVVPKQLSQLCHDRIYSIAEHFNHEPDWDDCPQCKKRDKRIDRLEGEIEELEDRLEPIGDTVQDELKMETFVKHAYLYNDQEIEYLLTRGKELLQNKDIYELVN